MDSQDEDSAKEWPLSYADGEGGQIVVASRVAATRGEEDVVDATIINTTLSLATWQGRDPIELPSRSTTEIEVSGAEVEISLETRA